MNRELKFAQSVSRKYQWALNPEPEFLETVLNGLSSNREIYGYYLCPCREGWGIRDKDRDIICPCKYASPDIEEFGHCFCGLFFSEAAASGNLPINGIPDRRDDSLYP
ncbi:MAG: ferredoxin:thioredoxin reductase [Spirochaetales bacterium]|nr:MAG: ferredoxin:thioredoxin reductase [Spirochaetales bacterium]